MSSREDSSSDLYDVPAELPLELDDDGVAPPCGRVVDVVRSAVKALTHAVNPSRQGGEEKEPHPGIESHAAAWCLGGVENVSEFAGKPSEEAAKRRGSGFIPPARCFNDGGEAKLKRGVRCPGGVSLDPEDMLPKDAPRFDGDGDDDDRCPHRRWS